MITFTKGNILQSNAEALVNSVNLQGVMGKGIALTFKKAFPQNYKEYVRACKEKAIDIGKIFVTQTNLLSPRYIINMPTKDHWRYPSKLEYIEAGLKDLVKWLSVNRVRSIAFPPLGSGQGKLDWKMVKFLMMKYLDELSSTIDVIIYEPSSEFSETFEPQVRQTSRLTPVRVMLLYLMKQYKTMGNEINLLVVQKLSYFLQKFGEPLRLRFEKGYYGPYAHNLIPVLKKMNGQYLQYRSVSIKPETIIKLKTEKFADLDFAYEKTLSPTQQQHIQQVLRFIDGFESPFGLELLATVDFILQREQGFESQDILSSIQHWTKRKRELIKPYQVEVALQRINSFQV
ncbi:MAG: macro domain-containing protein [Ignavibacteriae bacterium]|nr:macro domain-containing protein [Ignavibacteriota bacterium]